jgi:hypothetical protein
VADGLNQPGRAGRRLHRTEQNRTEQNRTEQNRTKTKTPANSTKPIK